MIAAIDAQAHGSIERREQQHVSLLLRHACDLHAGHFPLAVLLHPDVGYPGSSPARIVIQLGVDRGVAVYADLHFGPRRSGAVVAFDPGHALGFRTHDGIRSHDHEVVGRISTPRLLIAHGQGACTCVDGLLEVWGRSLGKRRGRHEAGRRPTSTSAWCYLRCWLDPSRGRRIARGTRMRLSCERGEVEQKPSTSRPRDNSLCRRPVERNEEPSAGCSLSALAPG